MSEISYTMGAAVNGASSLYPAFAEAMNQFGYDWEPMTVTTEDNYILTTFHILGKTGEPRNATLGSVLIQHGRQQDGTSWITNYEVEDKGFQLLLVDEGYDVWIGNNRGTRYSWGHETLDANEEAYWNFSWAEMGLYDDPANITAIKQETGEDKIFYIGYSQGTGQMHYGLSHLDDSFH